MVIPSIPAMRFVSLHPLPLAISLILCYAGSMEDSIFIVCSFSRPHVEQWSFPLLLLNGGGLDKFLAGVPSGKVEESERFSKFLKPGAIIKDSRTFGHHLTWSRLSGEGASNFVTRIRSKRIVNKVWISRARRGLSQGLNTGKHIALSIAMSALSNSHWNGTGKKWSSRRYSFLARSMQKARWPATPLLNIASQSEPNMGLLWSHFPVNYCVLMVIDAFFALLPRSWSAFWVPKYGMSTFETNNRSAALDIDPRTCTGSRSERKDRKGFDEWQTEGLGSYSTPNSDCGQRYVGQEENRECWPRYF